MSKVRFSYMVVVLAALCSCARSGDGTVVPKYEMTVSRNGWVPRVAFRKAKLQEPGTIFEPAPAPAPDVEAPRSHSIAKVARKRVKKVIATPEPSIKPIQSRDLHCTETTAPDARRRVVCMWGL